MPIGLQALTTWGVLDANGFAICVGRAPGGAPTKSPHAVRAIIALAAFAADRTGAQRIEGAVSWAAEGPEGPPVSCSAT